MIRGLVVDSFAGGGGASDGIRRALGRSPDIAINHDPEAIALHELLRRSRDHARASGRGSGALAIAQSCASASMTILVYRAHRIEVRRYSNGYRAHWVMDSVPHYTGLHAKQIDAGAEAKQRVDIHLGEKVTA